MVSGRIDMTRTRAASYDRLSRWYDLLVSRLEQRYSEAGLSKLAPGAGEAVLEIGFGTGHNLAALAREIGSTGRVAGVDTSPSMCRIAKGRLRRAGVDARVQIAYGDAAHLPFGAAVFDAILMSFTLELFTPSEIPTVLGECRRVLRPGGRLCVIAMATKAQPGAMLRFYERLHARWPQVIDCQPIPIGHLLESCGFAVLRASEVSMGGVPVGIVLAGKAVRP